MDFEDSLPLDTFLARREAQGEPLTEADGVWYDQETATRKAKKCHDADIEIVGIGFGSVDKGFIQSISSASDLSVLTSEDRLGEAFSSVAQVLGEKTGMRMI